LIGEIERRGARVLLFELPYSEAIEARDLQPSRDRSFAGSFPIRTGGFASMWTETSCAGRTVFIWTNGPR